MRLRSNTFVTLLLRAGHPNLISRSEIRENKDAISRSALLADLIRLSLPNYSPKNQSTLVSYFSGFIQGNPRNSEKYLPFSTTACRNGLTDRMEKENEKVLQEIDAICQKYLDLTDYKIRLLVAGIIDTILADETFDGVFDTGYKKVDKAGLDLEDQFILQPFFASVWNVILSNYPDTKDGAQTYEIWTKDAGYNTPREIKTDIGAERAKKTTVSIALPEREQTDTAENLQTVYKEHSELDSTSEKNFTNTCAENVYPRATRSSSQQYSIPDGVEEYLKNLKEKYNHISTILFKEPIFPFLKYYVPNDVQWHEHIPEERNSFIIRTINGGRISELLGISRYLVLSGTGGLGKSMMMRNLLLSSVDDFQKNCLIPFFIPLKDYTSSCPSILEYTFSTASNLWPQLTIDGLECILSQKKAMLLFDGLDEIHSSLLSDFTKKMNEFQDRFSGNTFIISSRPYSNFQSFTRSTVLYLQPLTKAQALELVERYNYRADAPNLQSKFRFQLEHEFFTNHRDFCANPLLLSILMLIFEMDAEVPQEKYLFYQEAYTVLSRNHDAMKDGFSRKLETGWNTNQFADYLAFFCAASYTDGQVSFSRPQMEQYFRKLIRKYHLEGITLDAFIHDLTNNLCLLYQDGPKYGFIHRSFQEYFCAKYFNAQLDELLIHVIPVFDRDDRTKLGDSAIEMLFDMKPKAVEKYLILPYLRGLIEECETNNGIWTFLDKLYDGYEMADGDACVDEDNCKPHSNLYSFILNHYDIPLLCSSPEDYPNIDYFTEDMMVYREDTKQDDWKSQLPSIYEYYYGEPEVTGQLYVIRWSNVYNRYKRFPNLLKGFISAVEKPGNAFMAEYNAVKRLSFELEKKLEEKFADIDLFDLME